jgi:hypothetical protein
MCAKSHIHQSCGVLPKKLFSAKGYAEIHIQRPVFDKIRMVETCSSASSTRRSFFLKNTKISIFGGISKFHLWVEFGKFWQFWADFPAYIVAESMLELGLKSSKPHNFSTMSLNVTCNRSLESYRPSP